MKKFGGFNYVALKVTAFLKGTYHIFYPDQFPCKLLKTVNVITFSKINFVKKVWTGSVSNHY